MGWRHRCILRVNKLLFSGGVTWNGDLVNAVQQQKYAAAFVLRFKELKSVFLYRLRYFQSEISCCFTEVGEKLSQEVRIVY